MVARTKATVGALLERWMAQHEIDATTRMTYESARRGGRFPGRTEGGTAPNMAELATSPSEVLTESTARRALTRACQQVGLPHTVAELIRIGSNAVFRVDAATIARVAPSPVHRGNAQKQIDIARWSADIDFPATRALDSSSPSMPKIGL